MTVSKDLRSLSSGILPRGAIDSDGCPSNDPLSVRSARRNWLRSRRGSLASFGAFPILPMASFGAGPRPLASFGAFSILPMASFGALPILPMGSFGAGRGPLASFGALPILPMASFGAVESARLALSPSCQWLRSAPGKICWLVWRGAIGFVRRESSRSHASASECGLRRSALPHIAQTANGFVRRDWLRSARDMRFRFPDRDRRSWTRKARSFLIIIEEQAGDVLRFRPSPRESMGQPPCHGFPTPAHPCGGMFTRCSLLLKADGSRVRSGVGGMPPATDSRGPPNQAS
jgi:hypothetical protein